MKTPFKFVFSYVWKAIYIDAFAQDERLLSIRQYACECLILMQDKTNKLNIHDKTFSGTVRDITHCVYSLKCIIHQCDSRLNSQEKKDDVLYTGKLSQGKK